MSLFQPLQSVREEMTWVLEEEGGSLFTVDIFNWEDRDQQTGEVTPYFDVEINLYNEVGERIDNWVTDIETKKLDADRRSREVLRLTKRWVSKREQDISPNIRLYKNRREIERYDKHNDKSESDKRFKTNPDSQRTDDERTERIL